MDKIMQGMREDIKTPHRSFKFPLYSKETENTHITGTSGGLGVFFVISTKIYLYMLNIIFGKHIPLEYIHAVHVQKYAFNKCRSAFISLCLITIALQHHHIYI